MNKQQCFGSPVLVMSVMLAISTVGCADVRSPTASAGTDDSPGARPNVGECAFGAACDPFGHATDIYGDGGFLGDGGEIEGLILDDDGWLTLASGEGMGRYMWLASWGNAMVRRVDLVTGQKAGLYRTADAYNKLMPGATSFSNSQCDAAGTQSGPCPARTSVDLRKDVFIANRGLGPEGTPGIGSVTKIANDEADCIDKNNNLTIETSRDLNGDGEISEDPMDGEFFDIDDECILWTTVLATNTPLIQAIAAGLDGDVWAMGFNANNAKAYRLDGEDGTVKATIDLSALHVMGDPATLRGAGSAATAPDGRVWIGVLDFLGRYKSILGYIDPTNNTFQMVEDAPQPATIADMVVAPDGRVFMISMGGSLLGLAVYDPSLAGQPGAWTTQAFPTVKRTSAAYETYNNWSETVCTAYTTYRASCSYFGGAFYGAGWCCGHNQPVLFDGACCATSTINHHDFVGCSPASAPLPKTTGPCTLTGGQFVCGDSTQGCSDAYHIGNPLGGPHRLLARGLVYTPNDKLVFNVGAECPTYASTSWCVLFALLTPDSYSAGVVTLDGSTYAPESYVPMDASIAAKNGAAVGYSLWDDHYWLALTSGTKLVKYDPATETYSNEIDMAPHLDGYGDSIGYNLENVADKGYLRFNVDGCGTGQLTTSWEKVIFDATFPAGSKIQVRARTAKKKIDLGLSEWSDPFVVSDVADLPVDLLGAPGPLDVGPFMQVEVELNRGTTDSPKLKGMSVEYSCNLIDD